MDKMKGLLPRMEAREWRRKPGTFTYRYHPVGGKPITLGTDRNEAVRKVLDLVGRSNDAGTVSAYWRAYQASSYWRALAERTQADYSEYAVPLLRVFGAAPVGAIRPADCARYLRTERNDAPVRANREMALLANILNMALEAGAIDVNPCKGVRRNKERPRKVIPLTVELANFLAWLRSSGRQWPMIAAMAEFAAKSGARRTEFLKATVFQVRGSEARLSRAKQREGQETLDVIELSPEAQAVLSNVRREGCEFLFPNRVGQPYTDDGFHAMWKKAMRAAIVAGIVTQRFTFHDLRAHYTTTHKDQRGTLPDLHRNPKTTATIYDRRKEVHRKSL